MKFMKILQARKNGAIVMIFFANSGKKKPGMERLPFRSFPDFSLWSHTVFHTLDPNNFDLGIPKS